MRNVNLVQPEDDPDPYIYPSEEWATLDQALQHKADSIYVAFPEVLGDSYNELVVNLGKVAQSGKYLVIAEPSPGWKIFWEGELP